MPFGNDNKKSESKSKGKGKDKDKDKGEGEGKGKSLQRDCRWRLWRVGVCGLFFVFGFGQGAGLFFEA